VYCCGGNVRGAEILAAGVRTKREELGRRRWVDVGQAYGFLEKGGAVKDGAAVASGG
jgi:hypothetical protein